MLQKHNKQYTYVHKSKTNTFDGFKPPLTRQVLSFCDVKASFALLSPIIPVFVDKYNLFIQHLQHCFYRMKAVHKITNNFNGFEPPLIGQGLSFSDVESALTIVLGILPLTMPQHNVRYSLLLKVVAKQNCSYLTLLHSCIQIVLNFIMLMAPRFRTRCSILESFWIISQTFKWTDRQSIVKRRHFKS